MPAKSLAPSFCLQVMAVPVRALACEPGSTPRAPRGPRGPRALSGLSILPLYPRRVAELPALPCSATLACPGRDLLSTGGARSEVVPSSSSPLTAAGRESTPLQGMLGVSRGAWLAHPRKRAGARCCPFRVHLRQQMSAGIRPQRQPPEHAWVRHAMGREVPSALISN